MKMIGPKIRRILRRRTRWPKVRNFIQWDSELKENKNKFYYEKFDDFIDRLLVLEMLIADDLRKYDSFVRIGRNPMNGNPNFQFNDEQEAWEVKVILDGFKIRVEDGKLIRNDFFKSPLYKLIREQTALIKFLMFCPNKEWRKEFKKLTGYAAL